MSEPSPKECTVCAVVVTYNRKKLLLECLDALRRQSRPLDAIYIIDNFSNDQTAESLEKHKYIKSQPPQELSAPFETTYTISNFTDGSPLKVHYVRMHENTGGAGGFYEGVKRAYEKGYDRLWLMDDDSEPKPDALEKFAPYINDENTAALACKVILPDGATASYNHRGRIDLKHTFPLLQKPLDPEAYNRACTPIDMASFVGLLIFKNAVAKAGFPKKEFFIHHDDVEYCLRLRRTGNILLIPASVIVHKEAQNISSTKYFGGLVPPRAAYDKFHIKYYGRRNLVWLGKQYSTSKFNFCLGLLKTLLLSIITIIIFDDHKLRRIRFILQACLDGFNGNFDNLKPKRLL